MSYEVGPSHAIATAIREFNGNEMHSHESFLDRHHGPFKTYNPGACQRLDRALDQLSEEVDWSERAEIKWHDRPEDMEPEAAEAPELARQA